MADDKLNRLTLDETTGHQVVRNSKVSPRMKGVSVPCNENNYSEGVEVSSNNKLEVDHLHYKVGQVVEEEESALVAELKKQTVPNKTVVFHEEPEVKMEQEEIEEANDDDIEEECTMVIDEQEVAEELPKPKPEFEMAEGIDHLNLKPVIVTDRTRKESFLSCLGLVTKEALSELQNKKQTRKRRSTANPHFSNAAIEAKRINQLELAAKKARRKEQMAEERLNKPVRMSLYRQPDRHLKTLSQSDTNKAQPLKDKNISSSLLETGSKKQPSSSSASSTAKAICSCFVCSESCDTELDVIMFCSPQCKCLFHATCASSLEDIINTGFVPCPKCDRKMSMVDEVTSNEDMFIKMTPPEPPKLAPSVLRKSAIPTVPNITKPSTTKPSGKQSTGKKMIAQSTEPPSKVSINASKVSTKPAKKLKSDRTAPTHSNTSLLDNSASNRENGDPQKESMKLHHEEKRKELESLMEKKFKLEQEWNERKTKLEGIRNTYKLIRDKSLRLEKSKNMVKDDIEKLVGFIRSVQIWKDIIDTDDSGNNKQQHQKQDMHQLPMTVVASSSTFQQSNGIGNPIPTVSAIGSNGQPITLNVPTMVVTANGHQLIASNVATIDKANGQPVISATVSSIGNKIISISSGKSGLKTMAPVTVGAGQKVLTNLATTGLSTGTNPSNGGTIEIMLQGNVIRNMSPGTGWVTVPVGTLPGGQKILMPRIITNVAGAIRPGEPAKTQVELHRAKKPITNLTSSPYIPIMKPTIPLNNVRTYSGIAKASTSDQQPQLVKIENSGIVVGCPQVRNEHMMVVTNDEINLASNVSEAADITVESVEQSEVSSAVASIDSVTV